MGIFKKGGDQKKYFEPMYLWSNEMWMICPFCPSLGGC